MTTDQPKNFLDLGEAELDQILKRLPLKDLLRCSRTCKQLQQLCENRFRQSYPKWAKQEVELTLADDVRLRFSRFAYHFRCLDNVIRNLTISTWNFEKNKNLKLTKLTNFMLRKCDPNLHKICIVGDMELVPFGQQMENFLQNVETAEFYNRRGAEDEAQFLKFCPNLRKLILGEGIDAKNVDAIIQEHYQHLKHFHYVYASPEDLNAAKLEEFFRRNDKIQYLVWRMRMYDNLGRYRSVECFQTLRYVEHLKHFRLCFSDQLPKYTTEDFVIIRNQLNELCCRDTFKSLEIEFLRPWSNNDRSTLFWRMIYFAEWKQLTKIHFYRFRLSPMIPTLRLLVYVKSVVLHNFEKEEINDELTYENVRAYTVPQVREVLMKNERYQDLTPLCKPLVRYWKNLNRIVLSVTNNVHSLDIAELNRARERLTDACELTIFTNHKSLPTNLQHALVKLRCEKFDCN